MTPSSMVQENGSSIEKGVLFHRLFAEAPIGIFRSDAEQLHVVNRAFARMFGFANPEEVVGNRSDVSEFLTYLKMHSPGFDHPEGMGAFHSHEVDFHRKDGSTLNVELRFRATREDPNSLRFFEGYVMDVSKEKEFARQIQHSKALALIGRRAERTAHDFNNVITAMFMHLRLLLQNSQISPGVKSSLEELEGEARRAAHLSRQLLFSDEKANASQQETPTPPNASVSLPTIEKIEGGSETILLVEDDGSLRRAITLNLRKLGYAVLEADGGKEALELWEKHREKIDLLFTDVTLPDGMNGMDLIRRIKPEKTFLKVIVSTGLGRNMEASISDDVSNHVLLAKPYEMTEVARVVRKCLDYNKTP